MVRVFYGGLCGGVYGEEQEGWCVVGVVNVESSLWWFMWGVYGEECEGWCVVGVVNGESGLWCFRWRWFLVRVANGER